jgi:hypothetical protein
MGVDDFAARIAKCMSGRYNLGFMAEPSKCLLFLDAYMPLDSKHFIFYKCPYLLLLLRSANMIQAWDFDHRSH